MADAEQATPPNPLAPTNPLSTVTDPELVAEWIMANQDKKDTPEFIAVGEHLRFLTGRDAASPVVTPVATEEVGFFEGIGEAFTGDRRETEETRTLPSYQQMPEFNRLDTLLPTAKVAVGTMMGTPDEMTKVITTQFPDITTRKDEKGNSILLSPIDGEEYVIKPGMELSDIPRGLSTAALFALLKGRGLLRLSAEGAGLQAGYESVQKGLGGDFNTFDVIAAGGVPLVFSVLSAPIKAAYSNTIGRLINRKTPPSTVTEAVLFSDEELVDIARRAAANDAEAIQKLAEMASPDQKVLEAARRLGIEDFLQPDHYTTDQGFREIAQIAKSAKPSDVGAAETRGLIKVGQQAFQLIEELGGIVDLSRLNQQVRTTMRTTLNDLDPVEKTQWGNLRKGVGEANRFNPAKILEHIEQRIIKVGGSVDDLSSLEQYVYNNLKPKENFGKIKGSSKKILLSVDDPTFTLIDDVRRTVGAASKSRGELGATADTGMAKLLYKLLDADVKDIAYSVGKRELYDKAKATTRQIVGLENDMISLFGEQVADSMIPVLTKGMGALTKGDADTFVRLINNVPEELRESVVASGLQGAFGRATLDGALNFNTYARWYDGLLRNRVAMNTMFKYLPTGARKQLSDLYRVSKAINLSTVQRVRTGRPIQNALEGDTLLGKFYQIGKRAAIGIPLEMAATPMGLGGSGVAAGVASAVAGGRGMKESTIKALDGVMASPQFANAVAKAGTAQEQETVRALAGSKPFTDFLKSVNIPPTEGEQFILSAFQSARSAASGREEVPVEEVPAEEIPPQASVSPSREAERMLKNVPAAPQTRGVPGLTEPVGTGALPSPVSAPPPQAVAQGPTESREMMDRLFPMDMV